MVASTRRMIGAGLALLGAIAVVWSAFITWYNGRNGTNIRMQDLFNNMTAVNSNFWASLFIPLAVAALVALVGIVLQSRWLYLLGGLIALATVGLWGLRQAQTLLGLHSNLTGRGPGLAAIGGALMLIGAAVATGRARRAAPRRQRAMEPETRPEPIANQPAEMHDEWSETTQAYQKGYGHGLEQASEPTPETETLGRGRGHTTRGSGSGIPPNDDR